MMDFIEKLKNIVKERSQQNEVRNMPEISMEDYGNTAPEPDLNESPEDRDFKFGLAFYGKGDYKSAREIFSKLHEMYPESNRIKNALRRVDFMLTGEHTMPKTFEEKKADFMRRQQFSGFTDEEMQEMYPDAYKLYKQ